MGDDIKTEVVDVLKTEGLDIAEELAVNAVRGAIKLIKAMLPKVNPVVSIVVSPMLDTLEPILLGVIDKIDGEDDPNY